MLKKYSVTEVDLASGVEWSSDGDALPRAEVVLVSDEVKDLVSVGDHVYFVEPREKGRCKYNGEDHNIVPISSIVAIL